MIKTMASSDERCEDSSHDGNIHTDKIAGTLKEAQESSLSSDSLPVESLESSTRSASQDFAVLPPLDDPSTGTTSEIIDASEAEMLEALGLGVIQPNPDRMVNLPFTQREISSSLHLSSNDPVLSPPCREDSSVTADQWNPESKSRGKEPRKLAAVLNKAAFATNSFPTTTRSGRLCRPPTTTRSGRLCRRLSYADAYSSSGSEYYDSTNDEDSECGLFTPSVRRNKMKATNIAQLKKPVKVPRKRKKYDVPEDDRIYVKEHEINHSVDVIPGRGGKSNNNPGNQACSAICRELRDEHKEAEKKKKITITRQVIQYVESRGGRFLTQDPKTGSFYVMHQKMTEEKVCQKLREAKPINDAKETKISRRRRRL